MSNRDRMTFGMLLSDLLGRANMTRAELARRLGLKSKASIGKWIDGVGTPRRCVYPEAHRLGPLIHALEPEPDDSRRLLAAYVREAMGFGGIVGKHIVDVTIAHLSRPTRR